jgi:hypothetical protein
MYAEKLILETDEQGHFKQLPRFPRNSITTTFCRKNVLSPYFFVS